MAASSIISARCRPRIAYFLPPAYHWRASFSLVFPDTPNTRLSAPQTRGRNKEIDSQITAARVTGRLLLLAVYSRKSEDHSQLAATTHLLWKNTRTPISIAVKVMIALVAPPAY